MSRARAWREAGWVLMLVAVVGTSSCVEVLVQQAGLVPGNASSSSQPAVGTTSSSAAPQSIMSSSASGAGTSLPGGSGSSMAPPSSSQGSSGPSPGSSASSLPASSSGTVVASSQASSNALGASSAGGSSSLAVASSSTSAGPDGITLARACSDGVCNVQFTNVTVTYVMPSTIPDTARDFFVQSNQSGPAIRVAVAALGSNTTVPGDVVSFTATEVETAAGSRRVVSLSGWSVASQGADLEALTQHVDGNADLAMAATYESELITVSGTVTGVTMASPTTASITTAGVPTPSQLFLRFSPQVAAQVGPSEGCTFTVTRTPLMRNGTTAEVTALTRQDFSAITCPAPELLGSAVYSSNRVLLFFNRAMDAATLLPTKMALSGTGAPGPNVQVASVALVEGPVVKLATTNPFSLGGTYTFSLAADGTAKDVLGVPLTAPARNNTAFTNNQCTSNPLVLAQVYSRQGAGGGAPQADFVEILNRGPQPVPLLGHSIQYVSAVDGSWVVLELPDVMLGGGRFFVAVVGPLDADGGVLVAGDAQYPDKPAIKTDMGAVALLTTNVALPQGCPAMAEEFLNLGSTKLCSAFPGPMPLGGGLAGLRSPANGGGGAACDDTNVQDFLQGVTPGPRSDVDNGTCNCFRN